MKPLVFLCMPRHSAFCHAQALNSIYYATLGMCRVDFGPCRVRGKMIGSPCHYQCSLLAYCFNQLWKDALNMRHEFRITHFAMLHSDVEAQHGWLDVLVSEMQRTGADVLSTVIPMKNALGLTSIGLGDKNSPRGESGMSGDTRRLTLNEVYNLPETFCAADTDEPDKILLPNTGCWIADLTKPWVDAKDERGRAKFHFAIHDSIVFGLDGFATAETRGEDWNMGYMLHDLGAKVYATRKVQVVHHGDHGYSNWTHDPKDPSKSIPWGMWETDLDYQRLKNLRLQKAAEASAANGAPASVALS